MIRKSYQLFKFRYYIIERTLKLIPHFIRTIFQFFPCIFGSFFYFA